MPDNESLAMMIIRQQLELLDERGKDRVIDWFQSNFIGKADTIESKADIRLFADLKSIPEDRKILNVAYVDELGNFNEIITDLKAESVSDAAVRATYVLVHAYCDLMDQEEASSRQIVVPFLKRADLYSGSMRAALKKEVDIDRNGDKLSLTPAGVDKALDFIKEMQDPTVQGRWNLLPRRVHHNMVVS